MAIAASIATTLILAAALVWATLRNLRDAHRASKLKKRLEEQEQQHSKDIAARDAGAEQLSNQLQTYSAAYAATQKQSPLDPDLSIAYANDPGRRPRLMFKIRRNGPVKLNSIGPLVSEEAYRDEHDLELLQFVHPDIDVNTPVECEMSGVRNPERRLTLSLDSALEAGGPNTRDFVIVEYSDSGGHGFSKRFFLYKNQDGSVVWSTDEVQSEPRSLFQLRAKLGLLKTAIPNLILVGEACALVEEVRYVKLRLDGIIGEATGLQDSGALQRLESPLSLRCFRECPESQPWTWDMKSLWRFQALYAMLKERSLTYKFPFSSGVMACNVPNDEVTLATLRSMLDEHERLIGDYVKEQRRPYLPC
jgi:hypothetical protein